MFDLFSGPHILIILLVVLLFFGPAKLPKLAQSIGQSMRELKKGLSGITDELKETPKEQPPVQQASVGPIPGTQPHTPQFTPPPATTAEPIDPARHA